jgi:hypothetical protein
LARSTALEREEVDIENVIHLHDGSPACSPR